MTIEYSLSEEDYLKYHEFAASKSEKTKKRKRKDWILVTLSFLLLALVFYNHEEMSLAFSFGLLSLASGLFYPSFFKWRYKKHYLSHIRDNYSKYLGRVLELEIQEDRISIMDGSTESTLKLSEFEKVDETAWHFFLKISNATAIIIPKSELTNIDALREKLKVVGLKIETDLDWA